MIKSREEEAYDEIEKLWIEQLGSEESMTKSREEVDAEIERMWQDMGMTTGKGNSYKRKCVHKWKSTLLIRTTVFDCELCGAKKEDEPPEIGFWD